MIKTVPLGEALEALDLPDLHRNLFSSPEWLIVLEETYGLKLFVKYIERNGKITSYIIYSVVKNFLEWKICICSYCDYFDCYVESKEDWQSFFESLREEYPGYRIAIRNLRDASVRQCDSFKILSKEVHHSLDIRDDLEAIWKRTHKSSFRSAVKQAQNNGVYIKKGSHKDLKAFYDMHLRLRKNKYRLFPQPYRFFENIWKGFIEKDRGFLLGAYSRNHRLISATIYLICEKGLYYKFNTSDLKFLHLRANNLLFWEGIREAKIRNLEFIDLGSSGYHQKGLISFKDHAGAKSCEITHLGFAPENYKYSKKIMLNTATRICTLPWMPDSVLRLGSHIIYSFLA